MTKKMLIDAAHPEETRVVVVNGNQIEEFDFESQNRKQLRGNIYLAKVSRVEPSLQAAFIEYGGNRHGFLAFNEIHPDYYQIPVADREALLREEAEDHESGADRTEDAETDGEDADSDEDDVEEEVARRRRRLMRRYKIQEVIKRRQIMLVQVVKEERGNKGAALTTYLSLAGRYGVLMPNTGTGGGISRKITTPADRKRLKSVVQSLDVPSGMGLIIRTAGAKRTKAEISRDYDYLLRLWENIRETTLHSIAPALIYEEEDLVKRAIRDLFDKDVDAVCVEGEAGYREARDFMRMLMPSQAKKIEHHREATPLFIKHKVEAPLAQIYSPTVPLKSGGYLVINQTEALVAIDVNSGKSTRERNVEATALKTNIEAAEEAARQLRLRDLAGLIVIDFIDMDEGKNNRSVEKVLKDHLALDRARIQMGKISSFGLMEISRQRRRSGVLEGTTHVCEHCNGMGRVRSTESSALAALRAVEADALNGGGEATLRVSRDAGLYILNEKRGYLARLHQTHGLYVTVLIDDAMSHADYLLERTGDVVLHAVAEAPPASLLPAAPEEDDFIAEEMEEEEDEGGLHDEIEDDDVEGAESESEPRQARGRPPRDDTAAPETSDEQRRRRRRRRGRRGDEPREDAALPSRSGPAAAPVERASEAETGEDEASRRRRRGRRGGRRMREEGGVQDQFIWTRPRVPFGDDPFVWHDPDALEGRRFDLTDPAPRPAMETVPAPVIEAAPPEPVQAEAESVAPAGPTVLGDEEVWVELPAPDAEAPAKKPRRRARGKASAEAEAVSELTTAIAPETEAAPPATPEPAMAEMAAAAPEPVVLAFEPPAPAPAPEPDPNEIVAPPAQPKRGWWRR